MWLYYIIFDLTFQSIDLFEISSLLCFNQTRRRFTVEGKHESNNKPHKGRNSYFKILQTLTRQEQRIIKVDLKPTHEASVCHRHQSSTYFLKENIISYLIGVHILFIHKLQPKPLSEIYFDSSGQLKVMIKKQLILGRMGGGKNINGWSFSYLQQAAF